MPHTTHPHRSADSGEPASPGPARGDVLGASLWIVAVAGAVTNLVFSFGDTGMWVHLICGAVTLVCGGILAARHLRGRRQA
jgi:hypothetical protein